MPIETINVETCTGCGQCVKSCMMDVIRMDKATNKAVIKYKKDCMACRSCEFDCPTNAIFVGYDKGSYCICAWG